MNFNSTFFWLHGSCHVSDVFRQPLKQKTKWFPPLVFYVAYFWRIACSLHYSSNLDQMMMMLTSWTDTVWLFFHFCGISFEVSLFGSIDFLVVVLNIYRSFDGFGGVTKSKKNILLSVQIWKIMAWRQEKTKKKMRRASTAASQRQVRKLYIYNISQLITRCKVKKRRITRP